MVALIYNPDIWESMAGELSVGISLGLNGEFQASGGYITSKVNQPSSNKANAHHLAFGNTNALLHLLQSFLFFGARLRLRTSHMLYTCLTPAAFYSPNGEGGDREGTMAHNYNPSAWEAETRRSQTKAILGYIVRTCLRQNK